MKKPEDKLEQLYQEKLGVEQHPVPTGAWERVRRRLFGGRGRQKLFWWSLSSLLVGLLAFGSYLFLGPDLSENEGSKRPLEQERSASSKKGERENDTELSGSEQKRNKEAEGSDRSIGRGRKGEEKEKNEGERGSGVQDDPEHERSPSSENDGIGSSRSENKPKQEKTEGNAKTSFGEKDSKEAREGSSSKKGQKEVRAPEENLKRSSERSEQEKASDQVQTGQNTASTENRGKRTPSTDETKKSGKQDGKENAELGMEKESSGQAGEEGREKVEISEANELPLMEEQFPSASAIMPDSLPPMGKQPEPIDISKGGQPLEHFFIRAYGAYGERFRSLKGGDVASFRNEREKSLQNFAYGLETGFRWANGLGAALGVERNMFGSDFSFSATQTLLDSSFSTDTNTTYIDSVTSITYDSLNGTWDTNTVIVDTTYSYDKDTAVSERDSSYSHEYAIRYRYVTVPVMFSYSFELGKGFSVVPSVGVGLNFLTRSKVGYVRPESHQKVRMRYPSGDPPLRTFALSFKGRLNLRYRFADVWRVGVGFRYSQFLQSVYTDEMDLDERPYGYGGSFSVSYLLD